MELSASLEDYLEAIFHLVAKNQVARSKDIAEQLNVNRSSVTGGLHALADKGLINYEPYGFITLTPAGEVVAQDVVRRHEALYDFLTEVLSIDELKAQEAACRMEHAIPRSVMDRLIHFVEFIKTCPRGGAEWLKGFDIHCEEDSGRADCEHCLLECLKKVALQKAAPQKGSQKHP